MLIRCASLDDHETLFVLAVDFATSFKPEHEAFSLSLAHSLADNAALLLVAEHDGAVVGYCLGFDHYTFYANGRVAWVEEIMVKFDIRGQGVGRRLMEGFEDWARERGARLVALATRRAAPFYTAIGYEDSATYFRKLL